MSFIFGYKSVISQFQEWQDRQDYPSAPFRFFQLPWTQTSVAHLVRLGCLAPSLQLLLFSHGTKVAYEVWRASNSQFVPEQRIITCLCKLAFITSLPLLPPPRCPFIFSAWFYARFLESTSPKNHPYIVTANDRSYAFLQCTFFPGCNEIIWGLEILVIRWKNYSGRKNIQQRIGHGA